MIDIAQSLERSSATQRQHQQVSQFKSRRKTVSIFCGCTRTFEKKEEGQFYECSLKIKKVVQWVEVKVSNSHVDCITQGQIIKLTKSR